MTTINEASAKPILQPVAAPPATGNIDPSTLPFMQDDFAYVDTETTGVDPEVDRICEIAIVRFRNGVREVFHTLVDPEVPIPPTASAVHHITDRMIRDANAPTFGQIAAKVGGLLEGAHVYAHNSGFDEAFVDGALGLEVDAKKWVCTVRLSRHLFVNAPAHGNQVLRYWLQTQPESANLGPHRAVDDVFTSLESTFHLWKVANSLGVRTHEGLLELSNRPIIVTSMGFGKHVGKDFKDIPSDYFGWCLGPEGLKDMDDDLRISMETELARPGRLQDDQRIRAERDSTVVPAEVLLFGKQHHGKPMSEVPLDYLEWMESSSPRCSAEVRAGVNKELSGRRAATGALATSPPSAVPATELAGAVYAKLAALVEKGSREEQVLSSTQAVDAADDAFVDYLLNFSSLEPAEYTRVSKVIGGAEGAWMRSIASVAPARNAQVPPQAQPANPIPASSPGRLPLFGRRQDDQAPEDIAGPAPDFEREVAGAPFVQAAAARRMRP